MIKSVTKSFFYEEEAILPTGIRCKVRHFPVKRIFDIIFSILALTIALPCMILIAIVIKMTAGGKVFFSHERIGRGGKRFQCYKFRTMFPDSEERLKTLLKINPQLREEWERKHKLANDPRITPIGRFLRKTSLDELPQFFNVLKGDMSVVGPRPVVQNELDKHFGVKAGKIFSIRPGITGPWQVSGRSDTSYKTRVMLDEKYVDSRSMMVDLKLIVKTIPSMISSKGAY
jgi:undecaprenyl-phosphate galactose phosphotransferase